LSLGAPAALFWLALAGPIIALYIVRVRLRRVPVSTSLFWKQIYEEKPPRSLWQSLRHLLSLLIQLLLLCLLALAAADPYLPGQLIQARRVVLVVDQSASMQADDVEPTRFSAAITDAHNYVDGLQPGDEMAIILADARPKVKVGMNSHVSTLRRALNSLKPHDGPAKLQSAIELARQLIGGYPRGRIIVLTDGCTGVVETNDSALSHATADSAVIEGSETGHEPEIQFRLFATDASNVGITQFQVRRNLTDPLGYEIFAQVTNSSTEPVQFRLELDLGESPVDILPMTLAAEEIWSRSVEKTSLTGGLLTGRLTQINAAGMSTEDEPAVEAADLNSLLIDDTAWAIVPNCKVQKVLIVTPGNLFLQKVFEASPLVEVQVTKELPQSWPQHTLIVLHQLVPPEIPAGNVLVIDPAESSDLWAVGEPLIDPIIADQDPESPLMTHVRLDSVLMRQVGKVMAAGPAHVLAGTVSGHPVYVELIRDTGRCLLLATSLDETDLAFRTTFPIMISNVLAWFAGTSGELRETAATGDVATLDLNLPWMNQQVEQKIATVQLLHPHGGLRVLTLSAASSTQDELQTFETIIGPLNHAGLYRILRIPTEEDAAGMNGSQRYDDPLRTIAVNVSNLRESDLRPSDELKAAATSQTTVAVGLSRPLWFYLVLLACALAVVEWILYNRRFTA